MFRLFLQLQVERECDHPEVAENEDSEDPANGHEEKARAHHRGQVDPVADEDQEDDWARPESRYGYQIKVSFWTLL